MGLLTSANTNIDVNFAKYFNNFENANPQDNNLGALYHYRELSKTSSGYDYVDINTVDLTDPTIRFTLYGLIASYKDDLAALKVLSSKINNLIPDFEEINQKIQGDVDL
jgi:hypothetical protein